VQPFLTKSSTSHCVLDLRKLSQFLLRPVCTALCVIIITIVGFE
jgi:hypothetical protein